MWGGGGATTTERPGALRTLRGRTISHAMVSSKAGGTQATVSRPFSGVEVLPSALLGVCRGKP
jgi:hypothetical protein